MNCGFKLWYISKEQAEACGARNQKKIEKADRVAIAMIGIQFFASGKNKGAIKRAHMQDIANLNIGYAFISSTKRL